MYSSTLPSTSALDGGGVVNATPRSFYPREKPGTHCTEGWVERRACRDGIRSPDRPARSESLYRRSYPVPSHCTYSAESQNLDALHGLCCGRVEKWALKLWVDITTVTFVLWIFSRYVSSVDSVGLFDWLPTRFFDVHLACHYRDTQ